MGALGLRVQGLGSLESYLTVFREIRYSQLALDRVYAFEVVPADFF